MPTLSSPEHEVPGHRVVILLGCLAAIASCVLAHAAPARSRAPAVEPLTALSVNHAEATRRIATGVRGAAVLRAQVLLDRAHFSSGEIDASYGTNLRRAIDGFQAANGLPVTGVIDAST